MHFPTAAVLLLGALQPALGKPAILHRAEDEPRNRVANQWVGAREVFLAIFASDNVCGTDQPWVGVWPASAEGQSFEGDSKAKQSINFTAEDEGQMIKFNTANLGVGKFAAAVFCKDGDRSKPLMKSKTFTVKEAPPQKEGQCTYGTGYTNRRWIYAACDQVEKKLCMPDCGFTGTCSKCVECKSQCGLPQ